MDQVQGKSRIHSAILNSAAKQALKPAGLFQKGRSRTWLRDQAWWMVVVEFQPSGWSRGSYLNVGCMWLWNVKQDMSFDVGYRLDGFSQYEDEQQFRHIAEKLATRALNKVEEYRKIFRSIHSVSNYYIENAPIGFWPCFDAAIAHSLAGRTEAGTRTLAGCLDDSNDDPAWLKEARSVARSLAASVSDVHKMREVISNRVMATRAIQHLPKIGQINFDAGL